MLSFTKRFVSTLFVFAAFILAAAEYQVMVLGDIHYDAREYHVTPDGKPHSPLNAVYINMWKAQSPAMLAAAAKLMTAETAFVVQVGDFVQGDAISEALHEKMLADAFIKVKSFFPKHRLLPVKGNHDVRGYLPLTDKNGKVTYKRRNSGAPAAKAFLPLVAKELGRDKISGNYAVVHNNDLYIFYDGLTKVRTSLNFLRNTLKAHPKARNVFFISHLPVLTCSTGAPWWLVPRSQDIAKMLMERNAIILTAHTHQPSLIKVSDGKNSLTQMVFSSVSYRWKSGKAPMLRCADFAAYLKAVEPKMSRKQSASAVKNMQARKIDMFELYSDATGFTILKVNGNSVTAELYTDDSGKPTLIKKLR